jgi:hypothetical protein
MPQSDGQVQNANFPAFRTDLNDNLAALFSQSSGASAPAVTQPFQPWIDTNTSPATWYIRNAANTGWITIGTIDATTFSTGGVTAIANGGTGKTTATAALSALLPSQAGNAGKALVTDGSLAAWGLVASGASLQVFTSSGTYTPTAGKTTFLAIVTGGGGDYDPGTASGGSGGTGFRVYSSTELGTSATVTIGAAGVSGNNGGNSVFDPGGTGLTLTGSGGVGGSNGGGGGGATNAQFSATGSSVYATQSTNSFWGAGRGKGGSTTGSAAIAGMVVILEW